MPASSWGLNRANPYLIVSSSGRALAASARRADCNVVVLDLFADSDLDALTMAHARIKRGVRGGFDTDDLITQANRLAPPDSDPRFGLVYGSGFEDRPDVLARLAGGRELCGNAADVMARAKDPFALADILDELGVPRPEIRREPPPQADSAPWLIKRIGGSGGIHIRHASKAQAMDSARYFQRFVEGTPVSALTLGDGSDAVVLGLSEQWPAPGSLSQPFRYGGAAAPALLPDALARRLEEAALAVTRKLGLVGLNSVDFIVEAGLKEFHVIEVNPRPGATLDIFERLLPVSLFDLHLRACRKDLARDAASAAARGPRAAASAILYAYEDTIITPDFAWPEWTADRPRAGENIAAGEPVCTVFAESAAGPEAENNAREIVIERTEALRATIHRCMQSSLARGPAAPTSKEPKE